MNNELRWVQHLHSLPACFFYFIFFSDATAGEESLCVCVYVCGRVVGGRGLLDKGLLLQRSGAVIKQAGEQALNGSEEDGDKTEDRGRHVVNSGAGPPTPASKSQSTNVQNQRKGEPKTT